jgi:hypothetical protein
VFETWPEAIIKSKVEKRFETQREKWRKIMKSEKQRHAEPGASPNGGPAAASGDSGVTEGPPSVS